MPNIEEKTFEQSNENPSKVDLPKYILTKGRGGKTTAKPSTKLSANCQAPMTPANVKRKQALEATTVNSPTDSFLSPCSKQLVRKTHRPGKSNTSEK